MADEEKSPRPIKVVDRRWFTQSGEPREELRTAEAGQPVHQTTPGAGAVPTPTPEHEPASGSAAVAGEPGERSEEFAPAPGDSRASLREPPRANGQAAARQQYGFATLVEFLAQQAILLLTGAEGVEPNRDQAKIFIDFLGTLGEKTKGNLTNDEKRMLDEVLFQLRAAFVQSGR